MTSFKYLGATLCKDGTCSAEVHIRIASANAAVARLSRIWRCNTISFACKFKLQKSLVTSMLFYGSETWTLLADSEKKDPSCGNRAPEGTCPHLQFGAQDQRLSKINCPVGPQELPLANVKRRKRAWFGHVTRHNSLSKTILQDTLEDGRRRGRRRKC